MLYVINIISSLTHVATMIFCFQHMGLKALLINSFIKLLCTNFKYSVTILSSLVLVGMKYLFVHEVEQDLMLDITYQHHYKYHQYNILSSDVLPLRNVRYYQMPL